MSELGPHLPGGPELMGAIMAKVAPAVAGAYVRNIFPPFKPWRQRLLEAAGGVLLIHYAGAVAAGATWAVLRWAGSYIGVTNIAELVPREQSDLLAAFLVGLSGMTLVEGALHYWRKWLGKKTGEASS